MTAASWFAPSTPLGRLSRACIASCAWICVGLLVSAAAPSPPAEQEPPREPHTPPPGDATAWRFAFGPMLSIPRWHGGVFVAAIAPGNHGLFFDARVMLDRPRGSQVVEAYAASEAELRDGPERERFDNWFAIDVGYARENRMSFTDGAGVVYLGLGWVHRDVEKRFYRSTPRWPGDAVGSYWVYDDRLEKGNVHAIGGLVVPVVNVDSYRLGVQLGAEGPPAGVTLGLAVLRSHRP